MTDLKTIHKRFDKEFAFLLNEPFQDFEDEACTKPALHHLLQRSGYYHYKTFITQQFTELVNETERAVILVLISLRDSGMSADRAINAYLATMVEEGKLDTDFETTLKLINSDDRVPEDVKDELRTCCINATDKVKELEEILNQ